MSTEIIKSVTFNEKAKTIRICSASSNVTPKRYDPWYPVEVGYDYEQWKHMFAGSLFDGVSRFQPSCKSKAKKAYDNVNRKFGFRDTSHGVWHEVRAMFPFARKYIDGEMVPCTPYDEENRRRYDEFEEHWVETYLEELDRLLMTRERRVPCN